MAKGDESTALVPAAELELAYAAVLDGAELPAEVADNEAISRTILERIMQADSLAAVLEPQGLPSWRDYIDRPCTVLRFRFNRSTYESKSSIYAVCDVRWDDDGTEEAVSCGGRNVLVQLIRALQLGEIPFDCRLTSRRTGEGFNVLWLETA